MQSKMSGFEPDLISDFPGVEMTSSSGCHEFPGGVMGSESFTLSFIESGKSFF